jgi:hypothetical protein
MCKILVYVALLIALLPAGCGSSTPSGGEPKPLPGNRIPPGHGPTKR